MSQPPAVIGTCRAHCTETRNYVPPLYLFPELQPFALHPESTLDIRCASASLDLRKSSWTVVELQHPATSAQAANAPAPAPAATVRAKLEALAKQGKLDFARCTDAPAKPAGWLPTSTDLVATLEALVDSVPGWRQDPETVAAVVSPHFLHLLAYQRLSQLTAATATVLPTSTAVKVESPEDDHASAADGSTAKRHRSEAGVGSQHGAPSVDPWDPARNDASAPSVSLDTAGPLPQLAETLKRISGRVWRSTASFGCQTDLRQPGTNWSRPLAELPEVTRCPTVDIANCVASVAASKKHAKAASLTITGDALTDGGSSRTVAVPATHTLYVGRASAAGSEPEVESDEWHVQLASPTVSRTHFAIHPRWQQRNTTTEGAPESDDTAAFDVEYWLLPTGRNGCLVNKRWYHGTPVRLQDGDEIIVGECKLKFGVGSSQTPNVDA